MSTQKSYYLGLDIGTDSVGYAVTNEQYHLLKYRGEPAWGVTVFDEASLSSERRAFRTARRRLDRRQQRVALIQELFASEISKKDSRFYIRIRESALYRDETGDRYPLFNDADYTDKDYYAQYPTIHHLICDLMNSKDPHDIRLVYLACAWLVSHRGHFLSKIDRNNLSELKDFSGTYALLRSFFEQNDCEYPWGDADVNQIGSVLRKRTGVTAKEKELAAVLLNGKQAPKTRTEKFPFSQAAIIKLLSGGTCKLKDLFDRDDYADFGSVSLDMDDEKLGEIASNIGDDFELIAALRGVYDWSVLVDAIGDATTISEAKVELYNQHRTDLAFLKKVIRRYCPEKYDDMFRALNLDNYTAYSYHTEDGNTSTLKRKNKEDFSKYVLAAVKDITPDAADAAQFEDMLSRLKLRTFLPKQRDTDNRVIPHQLYWYELQKILDNAQTYLPFLTQTDGDGLSVADKVMSVFLFRIPYFVGPLNPASERAWVVRKPGKILPWNFEKMVDLDASEDAFIRNLTGKCTYLPGEPVLPKDSLLYHKFTVLNEINNLRINGERIPVELKQRIYRELFLCKKKVSKKKLLEYLLSEGIIDRGEEGSVTGIDDEIKSNLTPQITFRRLLESGVLTEDDAERIVERASYAEDKTRLAKWLAKEYPNLEETDRRFLCSQRWKDFGRLSRTFLSELVGAAKDTGEAFTIIEALWSTGCNLMELLSDRFTFAAEIETLQREYYARHPQSLSDHLNEMYLSGAVKRSVFRTLDIVKDVTKAFGDPQKIFVEMTRGAREDQKGKRTKSRKQQLTELYERCRDEDVPRLRSQLEAMGDSADSRLQSDKLFLYYLQLGRSMYSGKPISLEKLNTKEYDVDHIYPQAFVKDDSIINNKVLVLSEENGAKSDSYPIASAIRHEMTGFWGFLKEAGLLSEEKYKRLTRATPFSDEEKYAFINRQLTETSQSTKAVATLLKEHFPNAEIVYCKAQLASEFRQEFDLLKSRTFNDLHHAVDAYLNIVTGNVYNMKFTKNFNVHTRYSIKTRTVFTHPVVCGGKTVWDGEKMLAQVKKTAVKNTAHFTKYSFFKKGGLFDQMPLAAAEGLVPLKKNLPTEKYGGYNKAGVMFFIPVRYKAGKKSEVFVMSVELLHGKRFLEDPAFAQEYAHNRLSKILNKSVDEVSFPLGMRPWKINTVLSLDGFRVCIAGSSSGGRCLIAQPMMQFSADPFWQFYLKKLEVLTEKMGRNPKYVFDEVYDKVSAEKNLELFDLYSDKLQNSIYRKRINAPAELLGKGREKFRSLSPWEQAKALLNIHQVFGRVAGGCDLTAIGGAGKAAATISFSAAVSNWKKNYSDVQLIDASPSGLWEKRSGNLLELI